jgi:hypothetical protein
VSNGARWCPRKKRDVERTQALGQGVEAALDVSTMVMHSDESPGGRNPSFGPNWSRLSERKSHRVGENRSLRKWLRFFAGQGPKHCRANLVPTQRGFVFVRACARKIRDRFPQPHRNWAGVCVASDEHQEAEEGAPKDATRAAKVPADARFDGQRLKLQDEGVYCAACGKYVGFIEVKHVLEHCFGSQLAGAHAAFATKTEEERVKLKHYRWPEYKQLCGLPLRSL